MAKIPLNSLALIDGHKDVVETFSSIALLALWHAHRGDWDVAHQLVQDDDSIDSAWVHGYLHRVEGDLSNARYWYQRAKKHFSTSSNLHEELADIFETLAHAISVQKGAD